ncbi:MarR family transcriptional regulator [Anaerobacillus alkaliphilus]|uniref:MarR family transcriptional regulator n=1 Tax=Anaerobacillus alkaliphilus TaxID=1548597 RepID=A0A4Q0VP37_9BACI|nr:MarR family transcriptional regulator [Anaerobacillus alkaliphilus]RXI97801.1 MarR family transcriptional regulator [Anaerobacillus alkaliphilus]
MKLTFHDHIGIKIHKTDLLLTGLIKAKLDPYNLAPEQNLIMMLLWEKDGITQNQLVEKLNKDKTNIARMASNLEKKGFIKRIPCTDDRRSVKLYLTPCGRDLENQVTPIAAEFNQIITNGISKEELFELERLLSIINENVRTTL